MIPTDSNADSISFSVKLNQTTFRALQLKQEVIHRRLRRQMNQMTLHQQHCQGVIHHVGRIVGNSPAINCVRG